MPAAVHEAALVVYALATVLLAIYAAHSLWLLILFVRHRRSADRAGAAERSIPIEDHPTVLVQLPVFNERDVVERLVESVGGLDWPRHRLRIQLLDDSTDDSVAIGRAAIERLRAKGLDAVAIHRTDRVGFKAGALAAGMDADEAHPDGPAELIAIFDADFVPEPDFLEHAVKPLLADPRLAVVQGRWAHLNRDANLLTRAQALGIDGHFAIEQGARAWSGLAMNFNGTCAVWRRSAIIDAGGWQHDTLTEDLDISYRAQLAGWGCTYRLGLGVPGEIPLTASAWRAQQFRWAKGSIQTASKLIGRVRRSTWPRRKKLAAILHLTHYLVHPLMLLALVSAPLAVPALHVLPAPALTIGGAMFVFGMGAPLSLYIVAQLVLGKGMRVRELPLLSAAGTGIAFSNAIAVWQALRGRRSEFVRTPKQGARDRPSYRAPRASGLVELGLAAWAGWGAYLAATGPRPWLALILALFGSGFAWLGFRLFIESRAQRERDWLVPLGLASVAGYLVLALQPGSWRDQPLLFALVGLALGGLYLLAAFAVRRRPAKRGLAWVIVVALGMRLASLALTPSDDVNRYVVEGVQVAAGENPYLVPPARSAQLDRVPADVAGGVNHGTWTAIYPPVTLGFEAMVTTFSVQPEAFKVALLLVELGGLGLVLLLLARLGVSRSHLLLAAWNPVGPLFAAGEGHHDFLMATLILLSLVLATSKRRGRSGAALVVAALAALTKPFALVAIFAQARLKALSTWVVPLFVALVAYAPFALAGPALFESLGRFGGEMHYHGALEPGVRWIIGTVAPEALTQTLTVLVLALAWAISSVVIWRRGRAANASPATLTAHLLAALLLFLPTFHPWYLAPLVMLLPFTRSLALIVWTAMAPVYWLHGLAMEDGQWAELPWVTSLAHLPALALLVWELAGRAGWRQDRVNMEAA